MNTQQFTFFETCPRTTTKVRIYPPDGQIVWYDVKRCTMEEGILRVLDSIGRRIATNLPFILVQEENTDAHCT